MAISDCAKCWETPCSCGYGYRNYSNEAKLLLAKSILGDDYIPVKKEKIDEVIELIEINNHHLDAQLSEAGRGLIRNVLRMLEYLKNENTRS